MVLASFRVWMEVQGLKTHDLAVIRPGLYNKTFLGPFHKINMCVYEKQFLKLVVMHNMRVFFIEKC